MSRINWLKPITAIHGAVVRRRRVRILAGHVAELLPADCGTLLDVGCGDGAIDALIALERPQLNVRGLDLFERPDTRTHVDLFDGTRIPMADRSWDVLMMLDVLHHTQDPNILLREAGRVARRGILIKDHTRESWLAGRKLALMDWVGNRGHGVVLNYNYWSMAQWQQAWERLGWTIQKMRTQLQLYPAWARPLFETNLHFMAYLSV